MRGPLGGELSRVRSVERQRHDGRYCAQLPAPPRDEKTATVAFTHPPPNRIGPHGSDGELATPDGKLLEPILPGGRVTINDRDAERVPYRRRKLYGPEPETFADPRDHPPERPFQPLRLCD